MIQEVQFQYYYFDFYFRTEHIEMLWLFVIYQIMCHNDSLSMF